MKNETLTCELKECQGELEKIAETQAQTVEADIDPVKVHTKYYLCAKCDKIYSESINYNVRTGRERSFIKQYDGLLTKEELVENAFRYSLSLDRMAEVNILGGDEWIKRMCKK